jgi:threonyl-tRNA synthetase
MMMHGTMNVKNEKTNISHLFYMDDLKLIAKSEEGLQKQIQRVTTFSDDIHMDFGLDKYAKITFKSGKLTYSQNLLIDINREIQELEQGKTYKYRNQPYWALHTYFGKC